MAKHRTPARPPSKITPTTKGASTRKGSGLPWTAPKPRGGLALPGEDRLFSQPGTVGHSTRQHQDSVSAAQRRMRGPVVEEDAEDDETAEADLDALGEGDDEPQQEREQEQRDLAQFTRAEVDALIQQTLEEGFALGQRAHTGRASVSESVGTAGRAGRVGEKALLPIMGAPASASVPQLELRRVCIEDTDRVWDWIRHDGDQGRSIFGVPVATSIALHHIVQSLHDGEHEQASFVRSLYYLAPDADPQHLGFVLAAPVFSADRMALLHVYLSPETRGHLAQLTPAYLALVRQALPGYALAVYAPAGPLARLHQQLLTPLGFTVHSMCVWTPHKQE